MTTSSTTSVPATTLPLASRTAATAVSLLFVVNGLLLGGYGGALPSLRAKLDIGATEIAVALFLAGAAAITSMQIGGRLADSMGARKVTLVGLPVLIAGAVVLGLAPTYVIAVVGAMLIGLGNGALDVAMNAIGVQVEAARGRAIMSFFHAMWSVGNFLGAGTVLVMATLLGLTGGEVVTPLMLVLAGLAVVALFVLFRITPHAAVVEHKVDGVRTAIPRAAWLLAIMALGFGLSEGTAVDWSSLHVTDVAQVDTETGSLGLVAVSGSMVLIRLLGDRLVGRFGRRAAPPRRSATSRSPWSTLCRCCWSAGRWSASASA
jgi:MFS family permease